MAWFTIAYNVIEAGVAIALGISVSATQPGVSVPGLTASMGLVGSLRQAMPTAGTVGI